VTETRDDTVTWLTQEAYDRLKAELDHLSGTGRIEIAQKIEAARSEGDLKENGGYHAAKEEQGKQEARIIQLTNILDSSRVGTAPRTEGVVGPGMTETVQEGGRVGHLQPAQRPGRDGGDPGGGPVRRDVGGCRPM
jgi:transcription elongation factor GreA